MTSPRARDRRLSRLEVTRRGIGVVGRTWLLVSAALLLVGAAVRFDLVTEERLGPLVAGPEVAAGNGAGLASPETDFESFPRVGYAGIEVAMVGARAIPENRSGNPIVVVELAVRNSSEVQARVLVSTMALLGPDGATIPADRFEFTANADRMVLEAGQTMAGSVIFKLRPGSSLALDHYALQIGERGRWPAVVPLDGTAPDLVFPQPLEVAFSDDQVRYRGLTVELIEASTALEYGVYRAHVGQHLAIVTVAVTGSPTASFAVVERDLWTLVDGDGGGAGDAGTDAGTEGRALRVVPGLRPAGGISVTLELVFAYSTESSELTLLVGPADDRLVVAEFQVQAFE